MNSLYSSDNVISFDTGSDFDQTILDGTVTSNNSLLFS
jgi:hypothetical protein